MKDSFENSVIMASGLALGVDIGSTTVKAVLRRGRNILFSTYERHYSQPRQKTIDVLCRVREIAGTEPVWFAMTGSAGLGMAERAGVPFVQEVFATGEVVSKIQPDTSCVIELGGEDAKIIYFDGGADERMNGSCAGGTGAFIDQMATLMDLTVDELDALSLKAESIYPIASRCGVFAKSDIQALLNQGAPKTDVAASVFQAVVNQTITGLAQGKRIKGKVLFLGGPLYYCKGLRKRFVETIGLADNDAMFPEYGRIAAALGTSYYAEKAGQRFTADELISKTAMTADAAFSDKAIPPLFKDEREYADFKERHLSARVKEADPAAYSGDAWLGIDCGSTTTKIVLISENNELLYTYYAGNKGDPIGIVRDQLEKIYELCGRRIKLRGSAVTGYGEELIKSAFSVDYGVVETIAHYTAANRFEPKVNYILDIGGQDIKCFKIKNGAIDSIVLNEACSSGCGSFLETFARGMDCDAAGFAQLALFASHPVDLGSRCTVFMNSAVKQAQRDGASLGDISAGLSISVVKNALYKVIRVMSADELGDNVVVQGGTFLNDAVLRAFERELGRNVVRPSIAGLMGAYGAALYSRRTQKTSLITPEELKNFTHASKPAVCRGCSNNCHLTVNSFAGGGRYISGNRCEKGLGLDKISEPLPNIYEFKRVYLTGLSQTKGKRGVLGIPLALGMYDLLPLWHGIFTKLGFEVAVSPMSTRRTYEKGQFSIPSDTVCYPAKLMHGHVEELIGMGVDAVFCPCLTYNVDEHESENHFNCPVVAYYPQLLAGNMESLNCVDFMYPFLSVDSERELTRGLYGCLRQRFSDITKNEIRKAVKAGFSEYLAFRAKTRDAGEAALKTARKLKKRILILAGRPYHIDSEICHGIDKLASSLGFAVVSEDSVCHLADSGPSGVLDQWTYHARLYRAAAYAAAHDDTELVQLVSFGCGVDAITSDEVRGILEHAGKFYTQIKIDELTNLGAVKIRLRSLLGALEQRGK